MRAPAPRFGDTGRVPDAYLAATPEELARRFDLPWPNWTTGEERQLRRPWCATPLAAVRAVLLHESPPPFQGLAILWSVDPGRRLRTRFASGYYLAGLQPLQAPTLNGRAKMWH